MTQISKAEVIFCEHDTCMFNDADVCHRGGELILHCHTSAIPVTTRTNNLNSSLPGALIRCKSYEAKP